MRSAQSIVMTLGLTLILSTVHGQSESDSLRRRGYFGVGLEKDKDGARVFTISEGSTAAAAGIAVGDFIENVDGQTVSSPETVTAAIGRHKGGESIRIGLRRDGDHRLIDATLKPYPLEEMANATVQYGSVLALPGVRLRTIVSIPKGGPTSRFPAVLLIQGGGCGSIDTPFSPKVAQPGLMQDIGSQGIVTMRVEKSGIGDSQGPPCDSIGFKEELAGYQAALKALVSHPSVDSQRIYLVGISLGGVFAPLLADETKVAGITVFGAAADPPPRYPGRSERFFEEFSTVDVAAAWARVATRVQVLHGEYDQDPYINRAAHERIAAIVNMSGMGSAQFTELAGLDHCWTSHSSFEASKDRCGQGEATNILRDSILAFIRGPQ
jgi:dienelactone hydrolase